MHHASAPPPKPAPRPEHVAPRESPAPAHPPAFKHDTVEISRKAYSLNQRRQAELYDAQMRESSSKRTSSAAQHVSHTAEMKSSGGFWSSLSKLALRISNEFDNGVHKVEHAVRKAENTVKTAVHNAKNDLHEIAAEAGHEARKIEHKVERGIRTAVQTVRHDAHEIAFGVRHEATKVKHKIEQGVETVENDGQKLEKRLSQQAVKAYNQTKNLVKAKIKDVEHGLESARNDIVDSRIGRDLKEGVHKGKEIAGHVVQSVKTGTRDVVTIGKSIEEHPKQFAVGALSSMGENMSLGMWQAPRPDNPSSAYYAGRAVGDVGGAIVGALPIAAGGALVGGGDTVLVLGAETGVAIPAGLGVAALGTGAVTYGTGVETKSSTGLVNDTNRMLAEVNGESGTKGTGESAYEIAKSGGKNSGWYQEYANKPTSQIEKGIKSIQKQIAEHEAKIEDPEKYIPNWNQLDPRQQENLINKKWPGDIARQKEQLNILQGILSSR